MTRWCQQIFVDTKHSRHKQAESVTRWHVSFSPGQAYLGRLSPGQKFVKIISPRHMKFSTGHFDKTVFRFGRALEILGLPPRFFSKVHRGWKQNSVMKEYHKHSLSLILLFNWLRITSSRFRLVNLIFFYFKKISKSLFLLLLFPTNQTTIIDKPSRS